MGTIQSTIGLITGMNIGDTVDKLMAISSKPKDQLVARTNTLQTEQAALTGLQALLYSVQYLAKSLAKTDLYQQVAATSSDSSALQATVTGDPPLGDYQFTPLRMVQSQQLLGNGVANSSDALGGGTVTFRFGSNVQRSAALDLFGNGSGLTRGQVRITDRSGASAQIDLSQAQTLDDVLQAINSSTGINVTAQAHGDGIRLVDNTGQTVSNLKVQEVGSGRTAASLGLDGIDVAGSVADGRDMIGLYDSLDLNALNDGHGVVIDRQLSDIGYTLRDGTTGTIDLSPIVSGTSNVDADATLGDVLQRINAAAPGKLKVQISAHGDSLVLTDLTTGGGTTQLESLNGSQALAGLGLDQAATDGVITGRRILGGAQSVLLSSLNGGRGLGTLGTLTLSDRAGNSASVDLSQAATLENVVDAINAAGIGATAKINAAKNGIQIDDTTGRTDHHLTVSSTDDTAHKLGLAVDDDVTSVNGGDLHLQVVARNTRLDDLNGGSGVAKSSFTIVGTNGARTTVNISSAQTVGDVIDQINRLSTGVHADINQSGDGLVIRDTAHGAGTLVVQEKGSTTAQDLHLLGAAQTVDVAGQATQTIDGSTTYRIQLAAGDSLDTLRQKINDLKAGVNANLLVDGSSKPYRLALSSQRPGSAGELQFDTSEVGLSLSETVQGRDALLALGDASSQVLLSSSSNQFQDALSGVTLTMQQATGQPVTVSVANTDTSLVANVKTLVDNYNKFRDSLATQTAYNADTDQASALTSDGTALRLDIDLSGLFSGRISGAGSIQSLAEVGISIGSDGKLTLDQDKLKSVYAAKGDAVSQFFTTAKTGFAVRLDTMLEQLCGDKSLIANRVAAISDTVTKNQQRADVMQAMLDTERDRLTTSFYNMELAVGKLQDTLTVIDSIQLITMPSTNTSNSS